MAVNVYMSHLQLWLWDYNHSTNTSACVPISTIIGGLLYFIIQIKHFYRFLTFSVTYRVTHHVIMMNFKVYLQTGKASL